MYSIKNWFCFVRGDQTSIRILRFAVGVTLATIVAYSINWPLSFLLPVLTSLLLSLPLPMPSLKVGFRNMLYTVQAFALGLIFSLFFLKFPLAYLLMLGLILFHLYYYLNRGGSFWFTLMSILSVLLLPMLANTHDGLAIGFSLGFIWSGCLTVVMVWISYLLTPDPKFVKFPEPLGFKAVYSPLAAKTSLKSAFVVFPLASLFIVFGFIDYLLVLVFSALFVFKPELSAGKEAGVNSLVSTLLGGACALLFYELIVVVPEFYFFIILMFLTALFFAKNIFSGKPEAKYYGSAFIALLVLVNGSMSEGADFGALLTNRILLITLATLYIVMALKLLDSYWPNKEGLSRSSITSEENRSD